MKLDPLKIEKNIIKDWSKFSKVSSNVSRRNSIKGSAAKWRKSDSSTKGTDANRSISKAQKNVTNTSIKDESLHLNSSRNSISSMMSQEVDTKRRPPKYIGSVLPVGSAPIPPMDAGGYYSSNNQMTAQMHTRIQMSQQNNLSPKNQNQNHQSQRCKIFECLFLLLVHKVPQYY